MLIFGTNLEQVEGTKTFLSSKFDMKDMGETNVILGIRILRNKNNIMLSQSHYIEKILNKFNQNDCIPASTPLDPKINFVKNEENPKSQLKYAKIIGCLMYATTCTRLDITCGIGILSRYTSNPSRLYWRGVTRILKYLKATKDYDLCYTGYTSILERFLDASWTTNKDDHSSISGWIFIFGGGAISWGSKKQTCITNSTTAVEFVALVSTCKEAK